MCYVFNQRRWDIPLKVIVNSPLIWFCLVAANVIVKTFLKTRDAHEFLSRYYNNIVLNATVYFQINKPACRLLAKTLGVDYFVKSVYMFCTWDGMSAMGITMWKLAKYFFFTKTFYLIKFRKFVKFMKKTKKIIDLLWRKVDYFHANQDMLKLEWLQIWNYMQLLCFIFQIIVPSFTFQFYFVEYKNINWKICGKWCNSHLLISYEFL